MGSNADYAAYRGSMEISARATVLTVDLLSVQAGKGLAAVREYSNDGGSGGYGPAASNGVDLNAMSRYYGNDVVVLRERGG